MPPQKEEKQEAEKDKGGQQAKPGNWAEEAEKRRKEDPNWFREQQ